MGKTDEKKLLYVVESQVEMIVEVAIQGQHHYFSLKYKMPIPKSKYSTQYRVASAELCLGYYTVMPQKHID